MTSLFDADPPSITITVSRSAGDDGAVVVFLDTTFEPGGGDGGPGLRVLVNDCDVLNARGSDILADSQCATGGLDHTGGEGDDAREAGERRFIVTMTEIDYLQEDGK